MGAAAEVPEADVKCRVEASLEIPVSMSDWPWCRRWNRPGWGPD